MKDQEILPLIRSGKTGKALDQLYKGFPAVRAFIISHGGNEDEAKDVFQEALIIFCKKAADPSFILTAQTSTYLYSVCRFIWKDWLAKKNKQGHPVAIEHLSIQDMEDWEEMLEKEQKLKVVDQILLTIGEKCLRMLKGYYFEKKSMKVLAADFGYQSEQVAKNQKFKCLEKAKMMAADVLKKRTP